MCIMNKLLISMCLIYQTKTCGYIVFKTLNGLTCMQSIWVWHVTNLPDIFTRFWNLFRYNSNMTFFSAFSSLCKLPCNKLNTFRKFLFFKSALKDVSYRKKKREGNGSYWWTDPYILRKTVYKKNIFLYLY